MADVGIIQSLADLGGTAVAVGILGWILYRQQRDIQEERRASEKRYETMMESDLALRQKQTEALINMYASIDQFNQINGNTQQNCQFIRESITAEVTRLSEISDRCKKASRDGELR